ncbi:MAG: peptidoglycan-binding domain-containing protein [Candidatus Paceibacterota bacterium]
MKLQIITSTASGVIGIGMLFALAFTVPTHVHAQSSGLTDDQINSILNLLTSFDAGPDIVDKVGNVLRGEVNEEGNKDETEDEQKDEEEEEFNNRSGRSNSGPGAGFLPEQASDRAKEVMQCLQVGRTLGVGSVGQDVQNIQKFLKQKGHFDYTETTGYFGPITQKAVQDFQETQGIIDRGSPETTGFGLVGPRTRGALQQATCLSGNEVGPGNDEEEESEDEQEEEEEDDDDDDTATSTDGS